MVKQAQEPLLTRRLIRQRAVGQSRLLGSAPLCRGWRRKLIESGAKERQRQTRPQLPLATPAPSEVKVVRTGFQVFIAFVLIGGWAFTALILLFLCVPYSDLGAETVFQQIAIHSKFTANAVALFVAAYCADRCLTYISR